MICKSNESNQDNNLQISITMTVIETHNDEIRGLLSCASTIKFIKKSGIISSEILKYDTK